ncbi:MAG: 16S rRNA (guanine(527)-N(7))-methyltransferase RsmG [Herpetosiphonaceae bacterium]|nr:16S rRNA (guanine(527)-N(7))-methyltransferase RsmG [Herpetosiphonaceae bacterium]
MHLSPPQFDQLAIYAAELQRWNERVNLTAITDLPAIATRHFLDSLACARCWSSAPSSLFDIGTGAGFPGLVLKILWPSTKLLLVDSVGKKTAFLAHMVSLLNLPEVEIVTARAEALGQSQSYREQYVGGVARAVAALNVLSELCLPLVKVGGRFVAPKGADGAVEAAEARRAIGQLGGKLQGIMSVDLPGVDRRTLVIIDKLKPALSYLPRAVGVPDKRPL